MQQQRKHTREYSHFKNKRAPFILARSSVYSWTTLAKTKKENRKYTNMPFWPPTTTIRMVQLDLQAKYQFLL